MPKENYLAEFAAEVLKSTGLDAQLSVEQKEPYLAQLTGLLEERVGLELLPKLSSDQAEKFADLLDKNDTTVEDWKKFWYEALPNFDEEIQRILLVFSQEVKESLI